MTLRLPTLIGWRHFRSIVSRNSVSLASRSAVTWLAAACSVASLLRSSIRSCLHRTGIDVPKQNLDLAADEEALEGRVLDVDVGDVELFDFTYLLLDAREERINVRKLALHGQRERGDRTLHAFQHVHAEKLDEALLAVELPENSTSAAKSGAVLRVIRLSPVWQDVAQRCVGGEVQPPNLRVDLVDRGKLPIEIDVRLHVDRSQAFRKAARLPVSVVFLQMTARTGDRKAVQKVEVVEPQHVDEPRRRTLSLAKLEPVVELLLRTLRRAVDTGHAVIRQRRVVALGGEGDLVAQVGQAIVHGGGRQHENPRLHAVADDPLHEPVVPRLAVLTGRSLVAEVVRLVDDDEIVVAPIHMGEVDIARQAAVAGQVGVIENVVVEAVARENVAAVVGAVEAPVVAQPLRAEHKHAVVAKLVVLDDCKRLEGLAESDAVGDDAAAEPLDLVDGADNPVALELEQPLPDFGVADPGRRPDDPLFVELTAVGPEQVMQDQRVDAGRSAVGRKAAQRQHQIRLCSVVCRQAGPLRIEPRAQPFALFGRFGRGLYTKVTKSSENRSKLVYNQ